MPETAFLIPLIWFLTWILISQQLRRDLDTNIRVTYYKKSLGILFQKPRNCWVKPTKLPKIGHGPCHMGHLRNLDLRPLTNGSFSVSSFFENKFDIPWNTFEMPFFMFSSPLKNDQSPSLFISLNRTFQILYLSYFEIHLNLLRIEFRIRLKLSKMIFSSW